MKKTFLLAVLLLLVFVTGLSAFGQEPGHSASPPSDTSEARGLNISNKPWTGDFDKMIERRMIRVLVPYSRTLYFNDKGRERGITADLVRDFERYINQKYRKQIGKRPITVYIIPTTRDKLFSGLIEGLGDIAAGNLTATEERLKIVDFVAPKDGKQVQELILTGPKSPEIKTLEDLSGKTVHVRPATSYYESVMALNARLKNSGKPIVNVITLPDAIEDEDKLEMLNAGLFDFVVIDDWKGRMWAQVLPMIKVREDLVLRSEGYIGWAIRKDSPMLTEALLDAYKQVVKKQNLTIVRQVQYQKLIKQISNNIGLAERKRFAQTITLFEKYGQKYNFDPLMLAAQGYQESRLDHNAKSPVGAIGVMQVMPTTGKELKVGDIRIIESNIHAGAKYMDQLMSKYFPDAKFSENNRPLFAFASYNAGPGNISRMRKEAAKRGLNPDKWFNNVELVVAEKIGRETTTYVRNIYKYYVAYKLMLESQETQRKAREQIAPVKN